jgi:acetylornithine deacetylase/succinyl-diaminopimelate desuccinylase-like protein
MRLFLIPVALAAALSVACSRDAERRLSAQGKPAAAKPRLGIRPNGDTTLQPDLTRVQPEDLKKVYAYIDEHIDDHVENLQKWIRQPSISNSGEGIPESAEMVKGFFEQLGCQQSRVYDVGITEWGSPGNPVVYAKCDEGAPRTLAIYWMYDRMRVTQPDAWKSPPFEARLVEQPPFKKVLIGRGATNSKGPEMAQLNALMSIKAVAGKLPVNVIFIAEGDEERMDIGLRKFVMDHPDLLGADALLSFGGQAPSGGGDVMGGSEGCVYIELTTSGRAWGRGPVQSDIHGANKRSVDSPAWSHIKMLASLVSDDGNTPLIKGFTDGLLPMGAADTARLKNAAEKVDMKIAAENLGVARFISDDPFTMLKMARYGISFNMDGIWSGNMYAGGAGAILPNKITSKHNMRYVPNMHGLDMVKRIREQLARNVYKDVELKVIGDVPWSKMSYDTDIARAIEQMYDEFHVSYSAPAPHESILSGGYWPSYLFGDGEVSFEDCLRAHPAGPRCAGALRRTGGHRSPRPLPTPIRVRRRRSGRCPQERRIAEGDVPAPGATPAAARSRPRARARAGTPRSGTPRAVSAGSSARSPGVPRSRSARPVPRG